MIGCGAIAQTFYLPALAKQRAKFGRLWLVDPTDHARSIAASMVPGQPTCRLMDVDDDIQLVIVATPNHLHFSLAREALARGAHVLLEKPFVVWPEEGHRLVEAAASHDRVIAINQTRRFFSATSELRRRIRDGEFGSLKAIIHREGAKLAWPFESGAAFAQGAQRTGVIMDVGVHVVDFYHYLFQPQWTLVSAIHDGFDGPEGLAEIELRANDATVSIRLSRYHAQENVARLEFEGAAVSFNVYDTRAYAVQSQSGKVASFVAPRSGTGSSIHSERLLLNFLAACEKREPAVCDAASSLPVIEILDKTYRFAQRYSAQLGSV